jgi:hypothetical protein
MAQADHPYRFNGTGHGQFSHAKKNIAFTTSNMVVEVLDTGIMEWRQPDPDDLADPYLPFRFTPTSTVTYA